MWISLIGTDEINEKGSNESITWLHILITFIFLSNSSFIHCVTSNVWGTNVQGSYLRLKIDKGDGCQLEEKTSFTYYGDPKIIGKITPSKSILRYNLLLYQPKLFSDYGMPLQAIKLQFGGDLGSHEDMLPRVLILI